MARTEPAFQVHALDPALFAELWLGDAQELRLRRARRELVLRKPGAPCRVTLEDAEVGETVLLVHHVHHDADTPFHASHAVYVREGRAQAHPAVGEIPAMLRSRLLSVRAFDHAGMMVDADVVEGTAVEAVLQRLLLRDAVAVLHLHTAKQGCYLARVTRP